MLRIPITPTSLVDVALDTVPPQVPVPEMVWSADPLRFRVPLAEDEANVLMRPWFTILPLTRRVLAVVPAKTSTTPPAKWWGNPHTVKSLAWNSVGVAP